MKNIIISIAAVLLFYSWGIAQNDFADVTIKTTHAGGNVYMLEGAGGNIGVTVGDDGIIMIDDQFAPLADKIKAALKELNPGELKFLLNTHVHGDHVGGNSIFGKETTIIAHENIRKRMVDKFNKDNSEQGEEGWPVITFEKSIAIYFNDEKIEIMHMPDGHTDGDAVIYFTKSNVVHTGDQFFNGLFPFIDLNSGGTVDGYINNVAEIITKLNDSAVIIPGHGPLAKGADYRIFYEMLQETTGIIRGYIDNGMSVEEIIEKGLGEKWASWSWSFIPEKRWIETIYNDTK